MRHLTRERILALAAALPLLERRGSRRLVVWTSEHDALLGMVSDEVLAAEWNLLGDQVWRRRNLLRILPYGNHPPTTIHWTAGMIRELGSMTDKAFAARHGMAKATASLKRTSMGIRRGRHPQTVEWTPKMIRLLGNYSDQEVARRLGLHEKTISGKRRDLGIPKKIPTKVEWDRPSIRRLLGAAPDTEIASRLGVNMETVRIRRNQAGIAPFAPLQWTPDIIARMGTVPDRVLAEEMGATPSTVTWQRNRRGIRPWDTRSHQPRSKRNT